MQAQNSSSITLSWKAPEGPEPEYYWVQWTDDGNTTGSQSTANTSFTAEGLEAGTLYEFSVNAVKDGLNSSWVALNASTGERQLLFVLFLFVLMGGDRWWWRADRRTWHPPSPRVPLGHHEQAVKKEYVPYKKRSQHRGEPAHCSGE